MFSLQTALFLFICISGGLSKQLPSYIQVCKREQSTINECVRHTIEALRPKLAKGLPELDVPGIDPFYIPEVVLLGGDNVPLSAVGKDVRVTGASNFTIKSMHLDLDTLTLKSRVRFPRLHVDGQYSVNLHILVPIKGQGMLKVDIVKGEAELVVRAQLENRDGVDYMKFTDLTTDIRVKDYHLRLDGLFDGDKVLGEATNEAINQNKGEFLLAMKPILENTASKLFLEIANKVIDGISFDEILPKP